MSHALQRNISGFHMSPAIKEWIVPCLSAIALSITLPAAVAYNASQQPVMPGPERLFLSPDDEKILASINGHKGTGPVDIEIGTQLIQAGRVANLDSALSYVSSAIAGSQGAGETPVRLTITQPDRVVFIGAECKKGGQFDELNGKSAIVSSAFCELSAKITYRYDQPTLINKFDRFITTNLRFTHHQL